MTENRSRARKVTRKAAPPSAETAAQSDAGNTTAAQQASVNKVSNQQAATVFDDGGSKRKEAESKSQGDSDNKGSDTNRSGGNGGNGGGGNRNRSRRSRGRGGRNHGGENNRNQDNRRGRGDKRNDNRGGNKGGNRGRSRGGDRRRGAMTTMQGADLTKRLPEPPALPKGGLRIVALGGISEIGRNMTVFEYDGRLLLIDCGVLFPSSGEPGVDLILPDFSYLEGKWDRVEALVITHGHEDHIGAIPWLLKQRADIPIVASRFTSALISAKTQEHRQRPKLVEVNADSHVNFGPFDIRFWTVNHSIPDCLGIALKLSLIHI